jgi:pimeloyl-ACP methyl ester carboxylesterase
MTIVVSNRHRIHFVVEGERGAFLILHHGLFGSHRDWIQAGYVDALRDDFRLIIPDARGHGRSEAPVNADQFRLRQLSDDLIAIMNELDIRNAHFVGYSLGALVGCDLIMRHPERVRLIMAGGEAPLVTEEARAEWSEWAVSVQAQGFAPWAESQREAGRLVGLTQQDGERQEAALVMLRAMAGWEVSPADQYQVNSPSTFFAAGNDPAYERVQTVARKFLRARFTAFPGHSHRSLFEQKETLLDGILRFIKVTRRIDGAVPFQRREGGPSGGSDPAREWRGQEGATEPADSGERSQEDPREANAGMEERPNTAEGETLHESPHQDSEVSDGTTEPPLQPGLEEDPGSDSPEREDA